MYRTFDLNVDFVAFVARGGAALPVATVECWNCSTPVDVTNAQVTWSRVNGDSMYGYEPCCVPCQDALAAEVAAEYAAIHHTANLAAWDTVCEVEGRVRIGMQTGDEAWRIRTEASVWTLVRFADGSGRITRERGNDPYCPPDYRAWENGQDRSFYVGSFQSTDDGECFAWGEGGNAGMPLHTGIILSKERIA